MRRHYVVYVRPLARIIDGKVVPDPWKWMPSRRFRRARTAQTHALLYRRVAYRRGLLYDVQVRHLSR